MLNGKFNHSKTGFALAGKHKAVSCKDCHNLDVPVGTDEPDWDPDAEDGRLGVAGGDVEDDAAIVDEGPDPWFVVGKELLA